MIKDDYSHNLTATLPGPDGNWRPTPELMTEEELILYLRIPDVSQAKDFRNAIYNLKRLHDLPRIHICGKPLYPRKAINEWIQSKTERGK
jgi:hypothetical protein